MIENIKNIDYYMNLPYTVLIQKVENEGKPYFFAKIEELPGCHTDAQTQIEALQELEMVKKDYLEIKIEVGAEIPEPSDLPSGKLLLRLPKSLHKQILKDAQKESTSVNQLILYRLARQTGYEEASHHTN
ncbi:toxin-antitoxin system HicB family antitoxin [Saccharibacillus sp. JS10]|uniref:toxin-antitoxin system HicB family antitoxin n=1 Tax=Saccharibacillus sp. JS10 TaxID=2950552 RepID=UPI00210B9A29|nr:toxin-antitoxin system HicB family antitoxin [Saccharibacillus sp. JS10]MCQ4087891.1 type II toxin-antitoxin system HicB family antitoxin [Saccharibacillus sp. JS10]